MILRRVALAAVFVQIIGVLIFSDRADANQNKQSNIDGLTRVAILLANGYGKGDDIGPDMSKGDLELVSTALTAAGFITISVRDVSSNDINDVLDRVHKSLPKGGVVLFYYFGHGIQDKNGDQSLVMQNNRPYRLSDIEDKLRPDTADSGIFISVINTCRKQDDVIGKSNDFSVSRYNYNAMDQSFIHLFSSKYGSLAPTKFLITDENKGKDECKHSLEFLGKKKSDKMPSFENVKSDVSLKERFSPFGLAFVYAIQRQNARLFEVVNALGTAYTCYAGYYSNAVLEAPLEYSNFELFNARAPAPAQH
jgi:hypothetical protein